VLLLNVFFPANPVKLKGLNAYIFSANTPKTAITINTVNPKRILECLFWFTENPLKYFHALTF